METKPHEPGSPDSTLKISEESDSLYQDLEFRNWDHGDAACADNPQLPLLHAATLLPSVLPHILEKRNALMYPVRFNL